MQSQDRTTAKITDTLPSWAPWALLWAGMAAASFAAPLIRYTTDDSALAVSFWRCFAGAVILAPFAVGKLRKRSRRELVPSGIAGVFLALHFASWIASVNMTSVAASVLLVSLAPIFVAAIAPRVLNERLRPIGWFGIGLSLLGTVIISGGNFAGTSMSGNVLAIIGGATAGYYVLAGQISRRHLGILEYAVVAYSVAGLILFVACMIVGVDLWGYAPKMWWAIAGLVVGPQLLGHTVINLVLSDIDATSVAVTIMAEPIIAIALAVVLFDEVPTWLLYPGGAFILTGVYLVTVARKAIEPYPE
jgi:drug/metabolite transporter (DMT)-like permease